MELNQQQQQALEQCAADHLAGIPGELRATITITRAATGKQETYQLVGRSGGQQPQEASDDRHA